MLSTYRITIRIIVLLLSSVVLSFKSLVTMIRTNVVPMISRTFLWPHEDGRKKKVLFFSARSQVFKMSKNSTNVPKNPRCTDVG